MLHDAHSHLDFHLHCTILITLGSYSLLCIANENNYAVAMCNFYLHYITTLISSFIMSYS